MSTTDTSERGLERLICTALAGHDCDPPQAGQVSEPHAGYGGVGWGGGSSHDYDREFCVDRVQLAAFLRATQPEAAESLALDEDGPTRRKFLARLQGEIAKRGTIDVLRHGVRHGAHDLDLCYGTPSAGNVQAQQRFEQNRFTVVRQLRYSRDETQRALDIGLFINGLPVFTFELKNSLTKQTVHDAVWQYQKDRNPREKLFEFGRCVAHFAVDESDVRFCTHLKGKASWFLPFNRGWNDGAGNPPNPSGIKTDYLWRDVLTRESLTDILENYAQVVEAKDEKTGKKKRAQIWPRYQQLDVVRRLLADAAMRGAGRRYLIQHSAGSGKSNSIAWLAHQLISCSFRATSGCSFSIFRKARLASFVRSPYSPMKYARIRCTEHSCRVRLSPSTNLGSQLATVTRTSNALRLLFIEESPLRLANLSAAGLQRLLAARYGKQPACRQRDPCMLPLRVESADWPQDPVRHVVVLSGSVVFGSAFSGI